MNFKETTDALFDRIGHEDLAKALGVSVASIRQARLNPKAKAFRSPPKGWQAEVVKLLQRRIDITRRLLSQIKAKKEE